MEPKNKYISKEPPVRKTERTETVNIKTDKRKTIYTKTCKHVAFSAKVLCISLHNCLQPILATIPNPPLISILGTERRLSSPPAYQASASHGISPYNTLSSHLLTLPHAAFRANTLESAAPLPPFHNANARASSFGYYCKASCSFGRKKLVLFFITMKRTFIINK